MSLALVLQSRAPQSAVDMILGATLPTHIVLLVLAAFSVTSWWLIFWKARQFKDVRRLGDQFLDAMEQIGRAHV